MYIKFNKKIIPLILSIVLLYGCAEEPAPVAKRVNLAKNKAAAAKKKPAVPEKKEAKKVIPLYSYDPSGKADPFFPFVAEVIDQSEDSGTDVDLVPLTELEKFALTQFKVVAAMVIGKKKVAMLEDPQGVGHKVVIGVLIGENKGRVVNIENGVVYVEEKSLDIMGDVKSRVFELAIETSEGVIK